jgi:hypothetical protein
MNDKELEEACLLFKGHKEDNSEHSGGETEGSDYVMSDEEETNRRKKKHKRGRIPQSKKEKNQNSRGLTIRKEEDTKNNSKNKRQPVIDVEALLDSGAKGSVTSKTIAAMTHEQKTEIIDTAEKL